MRDRVLFALSLHLLGGLPACSSSGAARAEHTSELERENAALRQQVDDLEARLDAMLRAVDGFGTSCPTYPAIDAQVVSVDGDRRTVILDKGERDGVKADYVFDVYRGSTYKGQVRIQDVQAATSTGLILHEFRKSPMASGDSATTQL